MKVLVIDGPNLDKLGSREEEHYGKFSLQDIQTLLVKHFSDINLDFFQSNLEGEIIDKIHKASALYDGLIINPGGYAHTSVAIHDALAICSIPKIEVHLSNLTLREEFRQQSITARKCNGYIGGLREISYMAGIYSLIQIMKK